MNLLRALVFSVLLPCSLLAGENAITLLKQLPIKLTTFERESDEVRTFDNPALGGAIRYDKGPSHCTVFVYDMGKKKIGDQLNDPTLTEAFELAQQDIQTAVKKGLYEKLEVRESGTIKLTPKHEVKVARYAFTKAKDPQKGERLISEIYVFGAKGNVVKLRAGASVADEGEYQREIRALIPALMDALRK